MLEWIKSNKLAKVTKWVVDSEVDDGGMEGVEFTENLNQADIITSQRKVMNGLSTLHENPARTQHSIVLDIDVPCELVRSSSGGNSHLYIDARASWDAIEVMLDALQAVGVLQPGYVAASKARKFTAVRLPWVHKRDAIIQRIASDIEACDNLLADRVDEIEPF